MRDKIARLHQLRQDKAAAKAKLDASFAEWEKANDVAMRRKAEITLDIEELEADIKGRRVIVYDGKDKSKQFGVGIHEGGSLSYTREAALDWAMEHKMALQLDKRGFEKIAKTTELDFVNYETVITATIATDLSKYLQEEG